MKDTIEIPKNILKGLYRIMCGVSYSLSGYEVYDQAKPNMKEAHEWIIKYGKDNNIDSRGLDEIEK